jgi:hypothetical protein
MTTEIKRLDTVDMTSQERKTFYALEYTQHIGGGYKTDDCDAYASKVSRDDAAHELAKRLDVSKVIVYDLIGDGYCDRGEAIRYVQANPRINEEQTPRGWGHV